MAIFYLSTATTVFSKPKYFASKIDGDMICFPEHPSFAAP
jgi:hypothetical protein